MSLLTDAQNRIFTKSFSTLTSNSNKGLDLIHITNQIEMLVEYISQLIESKSPFNEFVLSNEETGTPDNYYGYLSKDGEWVIKHYDNAAGTYKLTKGETDYSTNWTNRAILTYAYFNEL